ncbi:hypothetical protein K502DRAFT_345384 [Neoconidiobolus thromboides FSU 785]|nr:hypothetical protein K502DRAFT_345384 [Neoconidiobolus thromboides FSU 785]
MEENKTNPSNRRFFVGLLLLGFCLIAFLVQTEVTQALQKEFDFKNPYFILWFSHSFYMLVYPLDLLFKKIVKSKNIRDSHNKIKSEVEGLEREHFDSSNRFFNGSFTLLKAVILIACVLTLGAYLWYVAVGLTSMSSLTAIYNTSCFFAYLFSVLFKLESLHILKSISVGLSILGVIIISVFNSEPDSNERKSSIIGNSIAIISAILIGLFEVLYKFYAVSVKNPTTSLSNYITSYIGFITFTLLWIPIPILHIIGLEKFALPSLTALPLLMTNALMGVLYNAGLMAVITLTSPVFASVGVMITIPLVSLVDSALLGLVIPWNSWLGGSIIFLAFILLTRATLQEELENRKDPATSHQYQEQLDLDI